jgi:hypothetical protein
VGVHDIDLLGSKKTCRTKDLTYGTGANQAPDWKSVHLHAAGTVARRHASWIICQYDGPHRVPARRERFGRTNGV